MQTKQIYWRDFLIGILFVLTSLIAFTQPVANLLSLAMVFAVLLIVKGIFELSTDRSMKQALGKSQRYLMIIGIIDVLLGLIMLFNLGITAATLPYFFAIWFILDSVFHLFTASVNKLVSYSYYLFTIVIHLLGIVIGIMLFLSPFISMITLSFLVGFYLMWYGIMKIAKSFKQ